MDPKTSNGVIDQVDGGASKPHLPERTERSRANSVILRHAFGIVDIRTSDGDFVTYIHCYPEFLDADELGND